nr:phosphoglucomutase [Lacticigenium naphthae]
MTYPHLQNGSDIRGFAIKTAKQEVTLTDEAIKHIATNFSSWLTKRIGEKDEKITIAVGYDSRLTGPAIQEQLLSTFMQAGIHCLNVKMATTPALFMATQFKNYNCDAGIMITASHLPKEYNGLKFFTKEGGLEHEDIAYLVGELHPLTGPVDQVGETDERALLDDYANFLVDTIRSKVNNRIHSKTPLEGRKIIVDAGNGAGGFFAEKVLKPLGADTEGSQFLDPDGHFPNHIPNPDNKEAMKSIQAAVLKHKADLGIIFDTDVDRSAIVDAQGKSINRNNLIGLIGAIVLEENPGTTIVTNSPVSSHLERFIQDKGGEVDRYISGYRNVINRAIELNEEGIDCALAIETSGHAALRENFFLDDGAYLAAKILIADAKIKEKNQSVTQLIANLKEPLETEEVRFVIKANEYRSIGKTMLEDFSQFIEETEGFELVPKNKEGIRVNTTGKYGAGWFLLRMSLHEPKLVLQIESDEYNKIPMIKDELKSFFLIQDRLDSSALF